MDEMGERPGPIPGTQNDQAPVMSMPDPAPPWSSVLEEASADATRAAAAELRARMRFWDSCADGVRALVDLIRDELASTAQRRDQGRQRRG